MKEYVTTYPHQVLLQGDDSPYEITMEDNVKRNLIVETPEPIENLKESFQCEGFNEVWLEEKKDHQIGSGLLKNISDQYDMHIRFLALHNGMIAIDAEVETSRKWIEHVTADNWISVIFEITNILDKYGIHVSIWHKNAQKYVTRILDEMKIQLPPLGKIQTKHVEIGLLVLSAIAYGIYKYYDSKHVKYY